jgi:hypothetical protein
VKVIIDRVGDISVRGVVESILGRVLGRELLAVLGVLLINRHTIDLLKLALVDLVVRVLGNSGIGEVSSTSQTILVNDRVEVSAQRPHRHLIISRGRIFVIHRI